jgi:hypothetical protein
MTQQAWMIALTVQVGDNGTRQPLEQMLVSEEEHEHGSKANSN